MSSMITPEPTGTSDVLAIAFIAAGGAGPPEAGEAPAVVDAATRVAGCRGLLAIGGAGGEHGRSQAKPSADKNSLPGDAELFRMHDNIFR